MSWRETAKLHGKQSVMAEQLDLMERQLPPGDWVQLAGVAKKLEFDGHAYYGTVVYMVTTQAIYSRRKGMVGGWKDLPSVTVTDIPSYGFGRDVNFINYIGETTTGKLVISVDSEQHADAIADAVKDAYMHQTQGFPLIRPGSPEAAANDPQHTAQHAAAATAGSLSQLVANFRGDYAAGDSQGIWAARCDYGYDVGEGRFGQRSDWFWFNAYPALSGLNLGKDKGFPLSTFCGYAEQACDHNVPEQVRAVQEIKQRFFAGS